MKAYISIGVGSVSTKLEVLDKNDKLIAHTYQPTQERPIWMIV